MSNSKYDRVLQEKIIHLHLEEGRTIDWHYDFSAPLGYSFREGRFICFYFPYILLFSIKSNKIYIKLLELKLNK